MIQEINLYLGLGVPGLFGSPEILNIADINDRCYSYCPKKCSDVQHSVSRSLPAAPQLYKSQTE